MVRMVAPELGGGGYLRGSHDEDGGPELGGVT